MRISFAILSILAFAPLHLVSAEEPTTEPCTVQDGDNYYDLSSLTKTATEDYEVETASGRKFTLNVCASVRSETWNLDNPEKVAAYHRGGHGDFSLGIVNTTLQVVDSNPVLTYSGGSKCPQWANDNAMRASSVIRFICDNTVFTSGQPRLIAQLPPDDGACAFVFEWRTSFACPTSHRTGAGGFLVVFSSILFVALLAYVVAGTLYNRFYLGLRGFAQFPRVSFISWSDTVDFFRNKFRRDGGGNSHLWGSWGTRRGNGWSRIPEEEEAIANGRYSFDEDEEDSTPRTVANMNGGPPAISNEGWGSREGVIRL